VYNYWLRLHQLTNDATNTITIHRRIFDSAHVQAHRVCPHDHTPKSQQVVKSVTERGVLYWLHFMMMSGASGGENPPASKNDTGGVLHFDAVDDNGNAPEKEEEAEDIV